MNPSTVVARIHGRSIKKRAFSYLLSQLFQRCIKVELVGPDTKGLVKVQFVVFVPRYAIEDPEINVCTEHIMPQVVSHMENRVRSYAHTREISADSVVVRLDEKAFDTGDYLQPFGLQNNMAIMVTVGMQISRQ